MKSLKEIHLNNTAVKEFSNNIASVESLEILDLSNCPKLEKFWENGKNMKSLEELYLNNTDIK